MRTFNQTKSVLMNGVSVSWQRLPSFFSTAIVVGHFFSLFTWKRHHYLMRGHRQEFHIPTANRNLPRLACFFAIFSLPEFSWFFFQFFMNLWWEQMQKKQHKEDASALLRFGLIITSFPFFHSPSCSFSPNVQVLGFEYLSIFENFSDQFQVPLKVIRIKNFFLILKLKIYFLKPLFKLKSCSQHWRSVAVTVKTVVEAELWCLTMLIFNICILAVPKIQGLSIDWDQVKGSYERYHIFRLKQFHITLTFCNVTYIEKYNNKMSRTFLKR